MADLEELERAAGIDPESADSRLRRKLAQADDDLLEQLVQLRKDKGLTQQVVADRMKRDKAAVSNFERLSADPHLSTIRRYAAAIGASVEHHVQDFEAIESSGYESVVEKRFEGLLQSWTVEMDKFWRELFSEPASTCNVIYMDAYRGRLTPEFDDDRVCCDG
ncbi:helix-turn-helix domain-containing protein [Mycolicibacterium wolinskyi]|uniref:helix-turn-helix domain-containing protein n=1 Tax=Mycolicibacterium wolinskyi TaxID=59750 RepID=UPI003BAA49B7